MARDRTVRLRAIVVAIGVLLLAIVYVQPVVIAAWLAFVGYLFAMRPMARPNVVTEPGSVRVGHDLPAVIGAVLVFLHALGGKAWGGLALLSGRDSRVLGTWLAFAGVAFAGWSRWELGEQWSNTPALKDRPRVVRSGPYAWSRHPMYLGLGVASFSTAIQMGAASDLFAAALICITFWMRAQRENMLLAAFDG